MAEDTKTPEAEAGAGQEAQQQLPPLFNATLARLSADREEALAVLEMLFNRSVGIGEHTDIVGEITKAAKNLAGATGTIQVLSQTFGQQGQQAQGQQVQGEGGPQVVGDPNISTEG